MTTEAGALVFAPLDSGLRRGLEQAVVHARDVVESGVAKVVEGRLGVGERRPPTGLSHDEKLLRRAVLAKRRQAGSTEAAVEEVAFGFWHRILFARFLAENNLLIHPEHKVSVSLAECQDLAESEGLGDGWMVASRFASDMLPGLFPQDDPLTGLQLLPEDLASLEALLDVLDREVFTSDDGLGWVYQFWQSKRKDEVNASEVKIGARELPAVTQLFTEHYMVRFLLENSLGAWWATRHPDSPLIAAFDYLRFTDDGPPAAGTFDGWPDAVAEVTVMDPCCGSGHFLTAAFEMLWRMRAEEEHLTPADAQDAVLRDNLFGLEIDPRCTQIAAFNLVLAAWKAGGYRSLPVPHVACSGIAVKAPLEEWTALAGGDSRLDAALERLHVMFRDADTLGSLIDPRHAAEMDDAQGRRRLDSVEWAAVAPLLTRATGKEAADPAAAVLGSDAAAIVRAAEYLSRKYTLITTNPPFLTTGRMNDLLRQYCADRFRDAKHELGTVMLDRSLDLLGHRHTSAIVVPQSWLYLSRYEPFRRRLLTTTGWNALAKLGPRAFESISGEVVNVALIVVSADQPSDGVASWDATQEPSSHDKTIFLQTAETVSFAQRQQLRHPDARVVPEGVQSGQLLAAKAKSRYGLRSGDAPCLIRKFWEGPSASDVWRRHQSTVGETTEYGGRQHELRWDRSSGILHTLADHGIASLQGEDAWGKKGVAVSLTGRLRSTLYGGTTFDNNCAVIWPKDEADLGALWAFCSSDRFDRLVRQIDDSLKVTNATLLKVPVDVEYWRGVAGEEFPDGLPEPYSDDPTQWLFLGDPTDTPYPLQVAVARLLGYSWPDQQPGDLEALADEDGIVCLPPILGEQSAARRLQHLLLTAFQPDNPTQLINQILSYENAEGKTLEEWLRDLFFKQHCKLFHNRPFIWHIWDGHKDGFSALVNYHKLDRDTLKRLTNTYLKWWINRQTEQVKNEESGAEARLIAAQGLQTKLEDILEGEPPYDIYVRWKPLHEQPIGWEPDLNDGVRLNARPFVEAGVFRAKFTVRWGKDRGKNPDGSGRHNDLHYTRDQKQQARKETNQ